jgi:hypothetical protein
MELSSPDLEWREQKALIIGRAYPEPSKKHIETVCTGAITEDGQLLRLYPISWRYLGENQKYQLWTWARFKIRKSSDDKRKESYRVLEDSITILSKVESPAEQFSLLSRAIVPDRETLERQYCEDWTSMGLVEIEMIDFLTTKPRTNWEQAKPYIKQSRLDLEVKPLEQSPLDMKLKFRCKNNPSCKTHLCRLIGWEYMQAFRSFRVRYGSDSEAIAMVKNEVRRRFSKSGTLAYALLGTHWRYAVWMVGQLYFFPSDLPGMLFWAIIYLTKRAGCAIIEAWKENPPPSKRQSYTSPIPTTVGDSWWSGAGPMASPAQRAAAPM